MSGKSRARLYLLCTWIEAVVRVAAGRLKRALGMHYQPTSWDRLARLFLQHQLGRQPRLTITCAERTDGAGAQAHTIMSAINFARFYGHSYVHTPFTEIEHGDRPMAQWVNAWEELFNFGEHEEQFGPGCPRALNYSTFHPRLFHVVVDRLFSPPSAPGDEIFHPFFYHSDSRPDSYESVIPELRRKYYRDSLPVRNPQITVAVHLRRGDVGPRQQRRFTSLATAGETLRRVQAILNTCGEAHSSAVYSQGETGDFADLRKMGAALYLNEDALWTMRQLIEADILIMSKSSFSYVAALISDGIKLYEPFWHSPLSVWIQCGPGGTFDDVEFSRQLQQLIDSRRAA